MSKETGNDKIYSSKKLSEELNAERKKKGLKSMPEVNSMSVGGSTGTYARRDKSYSHFIDFYKQLFKHNENG